MKLDAPIGALRAYRNSRLYRPLARVLRIYNKRLLSALHEQGFDNFSMAFPQILSNLDTEGTRIGVLAERAGITRQAAGQLVAEIERCGYVRRQAATDDARATVIQFTPRGRKLLATILALVEEIEASFAAALGEKQFDLVRIGMASLADAVDPEGAFGASDETRTK